MVSLDSVPTQGARKAYWFKAAKINKCLFNNGMGLYDLLSSGRHGTDHLCAQKPHPSQISADSKCSLQFKAKLTVTLTVRIQGFSECF